MAQPARARQMCVRTAWRGRDRARDGSSALSDRLAGGDGSGLRAREAASKGTARQRPELGALGLCGGELSPKGYAAARFPGKRPRAARPHGCLGGWGWGSARGASVSSRLGKGIVSPNPKWEAPSQKKPRQGEGTPRRTVAVASLNWHLG